MSSRISEPEGCVAGCVDARDVGCETGGGWAARQIAHDKKMVAASVFQRMFKSPPREIRECWSRP